jgi:amino acid adenylation domain-containing protein
MSQERPAGSDLTMEKSSTLSPVKQALLEQRLRGAAPGPVIQTEIPRRPRLDSAPLSFAQRQMWVIDQMTPGNPAYHLPNGYRLRGRLDVTALERSVNEIIKRHEALRTTFVVEDGEPLQRIHPELKITIKITALDNLSGEERDGRLQALASEESIGSFDLSRLPLIRVSVFKLGDAEHVLIINVHHIVADGLSIGLLLDELDTFYRAFTSGGDPRPPELHVQYADFALWQRQTMVDETAHAKQIEFWKTQLAGKLPVLELPIDRPRPVLQSFKGSNVFFNISAALTRDLKALGAGEGCTLFMTLLAAFQVLLQRYSDADDIVIGTPLAARTAQEARPLIGNFLNIAALRCKLSGDPTFTELLQRTRDTTLDAFSNSDLPFEAMMKHLKFERDPSRSPIFQVLLQVLSAPVPRIGELEVSSFHFDLKFAQFDLSLHLYEDAGAYSGRFEYCSDLFEAQTIQRLCAHYGTLLEAIVREPNRTISTLPMLTDAERRQLLVDWNGTAAVCPRKDLCLHQLIEEQTARTPDQTAVVFEQQSLSYGELNRRANRLAHHLRGKGVGPDVLVGLFVERSTEMLVGIVGILKAGGAYVPIDPDYPKTRIGYILEDSKAFIVLTQESLVDELPSFSGQSICLDGDWADIGCESEENPVTQIKPEDLAYVLFTSGSTGRPKGVALEHRTAVAFVQWAKQVFTPQELAGVLFSTSVCFDLSVFEMFVTLSAGGKIVLAKNALHLHTLPEKGEVTLINTVPSAIAELLRMGAIPASVKTVNLAGEALTDRLVEQIYAATQVEKVYNLYGPTEATTYSTYTLVRRGCPVTIGRPITGTQCLILDARRNPVPIGVVGELYLAGGGLARGYYAHPELTNERFVPNPFSEEKGGRMYRTGDLCRRLPDGNIEYLGRGDHQVKLRGFRIELGEIEAVIAQHPAVREVAVIAREDAPGDRRLVAYLIAENPPADLGGRLRALARAAVPEYMVPAHFVTLEALPRTHNGKLDRKALPAPSPDDGARHGVAIVPRTPTEEMVAEIFRSVLRRTDFGVFDNFFDLGGHSLMAARIVLQLRAASGRDLPLRVLFERQTVSEVAEAIDALAWLASSAQQPAPAGNRVEIEL